MFYADMPSRATTAGVAKRRYFPSFPSSSASSGSAW